MLKNIFLLICFVSMGINAQKLDKSKANLKKKDLNLEVKSSSDASYEDDEYESESFSDFLAYTFVVKPVVFLAKSITYGLFVESIFEHNSKHSNMQLTPFPYKDSLQGNFMPANLENKSSRFDISNQFLVDGNHTYGNNLNIKYHFLKRMSVEYNQNYLIEFHQKSTSSLFTHDITVNYYRVRTKNFNLHYGLGANYVHSGVNKLYFSYNTGAEYFFKIPVSLDVNHRGTSMTDYGIYQTNFNLNFHKKNYALKAGLNFYDIGNIHYSIFAVGAKVYL